MNRLNALEGKIAHLKTLKEDLEHRTGRALYRKTQAILAADFTPSLALVILAETWQSATLKQKEMWQDKARTFPFRCPPRRAAKE